MLMRPRLLPDELAISYRVALQRLNGISNERDLACHLRSWKERTGSACKPELLDLADFAGVTKSHLIKHHTMTPFTRAFVADKDVRLPAPTTGRHSLSNPSLKSDAFFCADCVNADLDAFGRSYWRRHHQLPGLYWCPKHQLGLRRVAFADALSQPPSSFLDQAEEFPYEWVEFLRKHKYIGRYLDICSTLLDVAGPTAVTVARDALRLRAKPLGFQIRPNETRVASTTRAVLSHEAHRHFPEEWLKKTFPAIGPYNSSKLQVWLDGTLWMVTPPTSTSGYALAASLLFPSGAAFVSSMRLVAGIEKSLRNRQPNEEAQWARVDVELRKLI